MSDNSCKFVSVLITSCKGGVGKSTVTANLALALARRGKRVVAVDCDFSNRTLDLLFGCEDAVLYDLCDVIAGRAALPTPVDRPAGRAFAASSRPLYRRDVAQRLH